MVGIFDTLKNITCFFACHIYIPQTGGLLSLLEGMLYVHIYEAYACYEWELLERSCVCREELTN